MLPDMKKKRDMIRDISRIMRRGLNGATRLITILLFNRNWRRFHGRLAMSGNIITFRITITCGRMFHERPGIKSLRNFHDVWGLS